MRAARLLPRLPLDGLVAMTARYPRTHRRIVCRVASSRRRALVLLLALVSPTQAQDAGNQMTVVAALRAPASAESVAAMRAGLKSPDARVRGARRTGNRALIAPLILRNQLVEGWREVLSGASLDPVAKRTRDGRRRR